MPTCPGCGDEHPERARFCATCGTDLAAAVPIATTRKLVTVLFSDVTGSTALGEQLDPETLRALMGRYFEVMRRVIEAHGGTVEKFIGDAVMAVFGIPRVHEDDALRAVRAATEIRSELGALNDELTASRGLAVRFRTGINTGEVVAGDPAARQTLVTGDTVNTAARLEQAAPPGGILIGRPTYLLVRGAVEVEAVPDVIAKGKSEPLPAYLLVNVRPVTEGHRRRLDAPLVGRDAELARLVDAFRQTVGDGVSRMVTIVGAAGVGKSRLVADFRSAIEDDARILRGRCLSYGQGITYWPIGEIVRAAAAIGDQQDVDAARAGILGLLAAEPDGAVISARVASAVGLGTDPAPQEEVFWAIRRLFEALARERPLVVVVEDIHWAEPTLLDLLDHIADRSRGLLLVCPARPELLDARPAWGTERVHAVRIALEPLPTEAIGRLIATLPGGSVLPGAIVDRIREAAEGNPLYVEELVGMLVDEGLLVEREDGAWEAAEGLADVRVPPSINALLTARLERLAPAERSAVGRASVVGRVFEQDAVSALSPEPLRRGVPQSLQALIRKELVQADRSGFTGSDGFRFRHVLIRDAAYEALAKADRADLHEAFVAWVERVVGERTVELEGILGYHLVQALGYHGELGERSERTTALALRAARYLRAGARRARSIGDEVTAAGMLETAIGLLLPEGPLAVELRLELASTEVRIARLADARTHADAAFALARTLGSPALIARSRVAGLEVAIADGTMDDLDPRAVAEARLALREATASGDDLALSSALSMLATQAYMDGRMTESASMGQAAIDHAGAAGETALVLELEMSRLVQAIVDWTPAAEVVALGVAWLQRVQASPYLRADVMRLLAVAEAMTGRHAEALAHAAESVAVLTELGQPLAEANARGDKCWVHRLAGDGIAAEAEIRAAYEIARAVGDRTAASWSACRLAQVLIELGRPHEAEPYLDVAEQVPLVMNRTRVAGARARLLAARGDPAAAGLVEDLIVALGDVEVPNVRLDGFVDAAMAMADLGEPLVAVGHARTALDISEAKGNTARAAQVRALIARLEHERSPAGPPAP
ncbi:MAG TPA: adenylate/guanylate cyclase domain-containing protein [Candidatus Limnocylindrales bacterium]